MPKRRPIATRASASPGTGGSFRNRYDDLEMRREELMARLRRLGEVAKPHPGYRRTLTLLNDTFRKSKLVQRAAVLEAAAWMIDVLERVATQL